MELEGFVGGGRVLYIGGEVVVLTVEDLCGKRFVVSEKYWGLVREMGKDPSLK